jgi:hypothetical protein
MQHSCLALLHSGGSEITPFYKGWVRGFDSWQGQEIFLYSTSSGPALGPIQPPIQWANGTISLGVQRSGREANHSPPSTAEVNNGGAIPPLSHMSYWHGD